MKLDLETVWTAPEFFGLTTATPVQRAVCRVLDNLPLGELADHPDVRAAMGDCTNLGGAPRDLTFASAARCGKSEFAAVFAFTRSQTVDLSRVGRGDRVRIPIVSLTRDLGAVVYRHLVENVMAKPVMRALLVDEPSADRVAFKHPSGRVVEVTITSASRAGGKQIGGFLASEIYDECTRMMGEIDGVSVALDEMWAATESRFLPGGQRLNVGTPWAPHGPVFDQVMKHWRAPTRDLVVVKATGPMLNPSWWTPEKCIDLGRKNMSAFQSDGLAEFRKPEAAIATVESVEGTKRAIDWSRYESQGSIVVCDPSSGRGDTFSYGVIEWLTPRTSSPMPALYTDPNTGAQAIMMDAQGNPLYVESEPLQPLLYLHTIGGIEGRFDGKVNGDDIAALLARLCRSSHSSRVVGDQRESLMLSAALARRGVPYTSLAWAAGTKSIAVESVRRWLAEGALVIESSAGGDKVRRQLLALREKFLPSGAMTVSARGIGVDDYASLLITAAYADAEGILQGSPVRRSHRRIERGSAVL